MQHVPINAKLNSFFESDKYELELMDDGIRVRITDPLTKSTAFTTLFNTVWWTEAEEITAEEMAVKRGRGRPRKDEASQPTA